MIYPLHVHLFLIDYCDYLFLLGYLFMTLALVSTRNRYGTCFGFETRGKFCGSNFIDYLDYIRINFVFWLLPG